MVKRNGVRLRLYIVLSFIYLVYAGWIGYEDYSYQEKYSSSNVYESMFVSYVETPLAEKLEIESKLLEGCDNKIAIEGRSDLFCLLDVYEQANFRKTIDWFAILVYLTLPLIGWLSLRLVSIIARWVLTGK